MKKRQSLWLHIKILLFVILCVSIIAVILLGSVKKFSAYNINTPELTALCGFLGIVVAMVLNRFLRYKNIDKYECKELDSINKEVNDILESIDDVNKNLHRH